MTKKEKKSLDFTQMSVKQITQAKDEYQLLLASLEDQYRKADISDKTYKELKEKNTKKLEEVRNYLIDMGMRDVADRPPQELEEKKQATPEVQSRPPITPRNPPQAIPGQYPQPMGQSPQAAAPSVNMELIDLKMKTSVDKVNSVIDAIKESQKSTDDKIQKITETLGEMRALVYTKEKDKQDQAIKIEKIEEEMEGVKPRKIERQFGERDKILADHGIKVEKLGAKMEIVIKNIGDIQSTLRSIGNLENISEVNKDVMQKLKEMQNLSKLTNRLSDRVQKIFMDLNKKLELFMLYKSKQDSLDELSKEMLKTVDGLSIRIEDYIEKKDIDSLKNDIFTLGNKIDDVRKIIDVIIPIINVKIPDPIRQLQNKKESIEGVLFSLEESYRDEKIPKNEYLSAKEKNEKQLKEIESKLKREWKKLQTTVKEGQNETVKAEEKPPEKVSPKEIPEEKTKQVKAAEKPKEKPPEKVSSKEEKPDETESSVEKNPPEKVSPKEIPEEKTKQVKAAEKPKAEPKKKEDDIDDATQKLLDDLKDSLDKGLISKEVYEMSKKTLLEEYE